MKKTIILTLAILFIIIYSQNYLSAELSKKSYPDFSKIVQSTNQGLIEQARNYRIWKEVLADDFREMENYDVKYYKIDILVDIEDQFVEADNTIRVEICEDNVSELLLNFTNNLEISGIQQNGQQLDYIHEDDLISIQLAGISSCGEIVELQIQYDGYPENRLEDGIKFESHNGVPVVFTMVSPKGARKWWPCKDTPADKPDSIDIWVTYPEGYVCASNGLLQEQMSNPSESITDKWHESYPVATYLTSFAITNYDIFSQTYEYNGQTMPIDHYVYPEIYSSCENLFSLTPDMLDFFSSIYGEYPFLSEKYGHAVCTNLGALAMEHQTCTSYQSSYISDPGAESTVAHELAHQWAGDCLSIGSWAHVWLKEGFARYSEALWAEHLYGADGLHDFMNALDNGSQLNPCLYRNPDGTANHIFNIVIYSKGAWTMHMLRGVIGDDNFFQTVYELMQNPDYQYGNFFTSDLEQQAESVSGIELDWFFDEWFYNEGRPAYRYATYRSEDEDSLKITTLSQGNMGDQFAMYIPLLVNDISEKVFADSGLSSHTLPLAGQLDSLRWDPENWVLDGGYIEKIPVLEEINSTRGSILLLWEEFFDSNIEGFDIFRKETGGNYFQINDEPISAISYFDESVEPEQEYFYKIRAVFDDDENYRSKFSNEVSGSSVDFTLDQGILLVDETTQGNPAFPSNAEIDSFYQTTLQGYEFTNWDVEDSGIPPLVEMAKYSSIVWHSDEFFDSQFAENQYSLKSYLLAGGNIFISGWKHLPDPSILYEQFLHLSSPIYNSEGDFCGVFGEAGYPNMTVIPDKVPIATWGDNLAYIYKLLPENGGESILRFDSASDDPEWENKTCALKYCEEYAVYMLGFPLYYLDLDGATALMNIAMEDFDEEYSVGNNSSIPKISLDAYPNPSKTNINIAYSLKQSQKVQLQIFNIKGQLIQKTVCFENQSGINSQNFDTSSWKSGIYLIKMKTDTYSLEKKFLILR